MKQSDISETAEGLGVALDPGQVRTLTRFCELLETRGLQGGLISKSDSGRVLERHILDSLRAAPLVDQDDRVCDLGSGAGLPGLVVAIARPGAELYLVEQRAKRGAFLEFSVLELGLSNVQVFVGPAAEFAGPTLDVAMARAFAPPQTAWEAAEPLLGREGKLIYFAGAQFVIPDENALPGVKFALERGAVLETGGPLVIMSRK